MKYKILLGLTILIFLCTRLFKIAEIPGSVYWDEASIGYNAYSIGVDLKDEWGQTLPLHFRAFGEFKLPVYIYSVVPFVKILGLNAYAVRIPAVLYSLGTLIILYLLGSAITGKKFIGIFSAFIFTVSPWMFIFSRTGYEATAGVFFFLLGTYLFVFPKGRRSNFVISTLAFMFSFYSYNSFRIIIPIWLVILFIYKFHDLSTLKKNWLFIGISFTIFVAGLIPVYRLYKYDTGGTRLAQVGVKDKRQIVKNYFSNLNPKYLFISGDPNGRSQLPKQGELYLIDAPLILLGLFYILKSKKPIYFLPLALLLLGIIPAAITKESPHALRAILAAPSFALIAALGIGMLTNFAKKSPEVIFVIVALFYTLFFSEYFNNFVTKYQNLTASDWQYEYKEIFARYKEGIVTDQYAQPYIFALFYEKYNPAKFRSEVVYNPPDKWGMSLVSSFNGYIFK